MDSCHFWLVDGGSLLPQVSNSHLQKQSSFIYKKLKQDVGDLDSDCVFVTLAIAFPSLKLFFFL